MTRPFLTARWESLLLVNYLCPGEVLRPLVPPGTELDDWEGRFLVSLVGFRFVDTKVRGVPIPGHRTFEEVNLRFYVRRESDGELRRGVVFVKELVPRWAIAAVARELYNEPYEAVEMDHDVALDPVSGGQVDYSWRHDAGRYALRATASGAATELTTGSEAEFITEHYWGYTRQKDGSTLEYRVAHPPWLVWTCSAEYVRPEGESLYGPDFTPVLAADSVSAFLAVGSEVEVFPGVRIT